ncbi:MAG: serine hydrolase [Candidatus Marinimicrobia bacterium]|nr:serine hydrolase [Candidatus Neomarinimicrobiota bacterium]
MRRFYIMTLSLIMASLFLTGCARHMLKYDSLTKILEDAVADSAWPGGVLMIGQGDEIIYQQAIGYHTYSQEKTTEINDIFDLASISKVVGTTSAVMKLVENGQLSLDDPAVKYVPELQGPDDIQTALKRSITVRHLLTHTAGFEPFRLFYKMDCTVEARWDSVFQSELKTKPGAQTVYSDIGLMIMGKIVESITGMPQNEYLEKTIFAPLKMIDTGYLPDPALLDRIIPTEIKEEGLIHGYVHDENTHSLGGVAGHAGLFSTILDLSRFCRMMLHDGELDGVRIFNPETIKLFTTRIDPNNSRCLGWDSPEGECSGGIYISPHSFGHTGYTGTSLWIDTENNVYVILLTNAVHPDRSYKYPNYFEWRQLLHSAAYEELELTKRNHEVRLKEGWVKKFGIQR